jgi:hypothetical protein
MIERTLKIASICVSLRKGSSNPLVMNALPGLAPDATVIREAFATFIAVHGGRR